MSAKPMAGEGKTGCRSDGSEGGDEVVLPEEVESGQSLAKPESSASLE